MVLLKVNREEPEKTPLSLNCTCVLEPPGVVAVGANIVIEPLELDVTVAAPEAMR